MIEWDDRARKELRKLGASLQKDILKYFRDRIAVDNDPRRFGKALSYDKHGLWCYRIQNARIICRIEEDDLLVIVMRVGYRKDVYDF